jgi:hypothetical protein
VIRRLIVCALFFANIVCLSQASTAGWQSRDSNYNMSVGAALPTDAELREDNSFELREDGGFELRDG